MAFVAYIGEDESCTVFGMTFPRDEPVYLDAYKHQRALSKLRHNPQFDVCEWEQSIIVEGRLLARAAPCNPAPDT
jgi:hypothetical protein